MKNGRGVYKATDLSLNPIDLEIRKSNEFKNLLLIDIIGVDIIFYHLNCLIFLIYITAENSVMAYWAILEILSTIKYFTSLSDHSSTIAYELDNSCQCIPLNQCDKCDDPSHKRLLKNSSPEYRQFFVNAIKFLV